MRYLLSESTYLLSNDVLYSRPKTFLDADHHHQQALLDHFDLFMPISNMVKVEVHRELEVDHLIDIHLVPRDHTRNLQVPAEDQNHRTENDLEKPKTMDSSVTVQFHHPVICIR